MTMNTATHIRDIEGERGNVALYRLDPPLTYTHYTEDEELEAHYVYVSAVPHIPETYIFPAPGPDTVDLEPVSWSELPGSMRDTIDHADALNSAGYVVVR